jgi:hypothetical protein
MCFTFGPEKLNPINGIKGGKGECLSMAPLQSGLIVEQIDGDVFGLKTCATPPFALKRGKTTLKALGAKAHVKFVSEVIITENLIVRPGEDATAADIDAILNGAKFVNPDTSTIVPPLCRD